MTAIHSVRREAGALLSTTSQQPALKPTERTNGSAMSLVRHASIPPRVIPSALAALAASKVFFCNGMNNTRRDAIAFCQHFRRQLGVLPELIYNDATSPQHIKRIGALAGTSTALTFLGAAISVAVAPILTPIFVGTAAVEGLLIGQELRNIQDNKRDLATEMAERVATYLATHPKEHIVLIAHSQGAHVTDLALDQLKCLRHRIRVITIGGLVGICPKKASRVVNILNQGDSVAGTLAPSYVRGVISGHVTGCGGHVKTTAHTEHLGHGAIHYLKNPAFLNSFKVLRR